MPPISEMKTLRIDEVAEILQVKPRTVYHWIEGSIAQVLRKLRSGLKIRELELRPRSRSFVHWIPWDYRCQKRAKAKVVPANAAKLNSPPIVSDKGA